MRRKSSSRNGPAPAALAAAGCLVLCSGLAVAQPASPAAPRDEPSWARAIRLAEQSGRPSLIVVTSRSRPESGRLLRELQQSPRHDGLRRAVSLAELPSEGASEQLARLKVETAPAVVVYSRGRRGTAQVWSESRSMDPAFVLGWLSALGLAIEPTAPDAALVRASQLPEGEGATAEGDQGADPGLRRVQYPPGQTHASGQSQPPPQRPYVPPAPQQYYAPPPPQAPPAFGIPPAAPVFVQPQPSPVFVQPQPTTVFVGAAPPPNIVIASAPSSSPTVTYANAPQPAPAPPNAFVPAPAPPAGYPPAPPYAPAPPMMYAPAPPNYAPAPPPNYAPAPAPAPVAQAPAMTMTLTQPSLLNRVVGTIGEHFAQKKNPRVQMAQAPAMSPVAPAPYGASPYAPAPFGPAGAPVAYGFAAHPTGYAPAPAYGYAPAAPYGYAPAAPYGYVPGPPTGYGSYPPQYSPPPQDEAPPTPSPQRERPRRFMPAPPKANP